MVTMTETHFAGAVILRLQTTISLNARREIAQRLLFNLAADNECKIIGL
jgi:hypothetical protein